MIALAPVTLVAGAAGLDWSQYPDTSEVRLSNHSGFVLTVTIGGAQYILDPYTADRYFSRGQLSLTYIAAATISPTSAGTLLVTVANLPGERIPGVYPLHLT